MSADLQPLADALALLEDMTTEAFSWGADRPVREALAQYLHTQGEPEILLEYVPCPERRGNRRCVYGFGHSETFRHRYEAVGDA